MTLNYDKMYPTRAFDPLMKAQSVPWLVENLWQRGKINGLAGFEKAGKSRVLGWLLTGLFTGRVLGLSCTSPTRVLYLAGEETTEDINSRLVRYSKLQGLSASLPIDFVQASGMRLEMRAQRQWLEAKLPQYDLLIVDPMRRVHAADEDNSTAMSVIYNDVRKWSNQLGLTIILLHHTPKVNMDTDMTRMANWFRGSTDMAAILDVGNFIDRSASNIGIHRAGRFAPLSPLRIVDAGDAKGFFNR